MWMDSFVLVLFLPVWLLWALTCAAIPLRCPANCEIYGIHRNTINRLNQECPSTDTFIKCSTSIWLTANGSLNVAFDGDSSAQALNDSLNSQQPGRFFFHHTQITYYGGVSEILSYIRYSCFNQDDCSRQYAQTMGSQLLSYQYSNLDKSIRPLIYDPNANSEYNFFTSNLTCLVNDSTTIVPCNTSCYYYSGLFQEQLQCWPSTLVGMHVYTQNAMPAPENTTISFDYNCNIQAPICNEQNVYDNMKTIVEDFFRNPPYISSSQKCKTHQTAFAMMFIFVFRHFCDQFDHSQD